MRRATSAEKARRSVHRALMARGSGWTKPIFCANVQAVRPAERGNGSTEIQKVPHWLDYQTILGYGYALAEPPGERA